jgi:hypothetical protein
MSSNIVKGGALIHDTRLFVEAWDDDLPRGDNLHRIVDGNALGLPTQSRASDVTTYALRPRFVDPGPEVLKALRILRSASDGFVDACYFEATRADELLARFAEEAISSWYGEGRISVTVDLAEQWLVQLADKGDVADWSENLRRRVAQGLVATLRDFGRLEGPRRSPNKRIANPGISFPGFAYVAFRLQEMVSSARAVVSSPVWRRWVLDEQRIDDLFHRAATHGLLYFSTAGTALRIDWRLHSLEEVIRVAV